MRVALHRVESDCLKPIYDNAVSKEETLEVVVPDVCADVGKLLDVRGQLLVTSQKTRMNEILIGAMVEVTVLYVAEDSGKVQYVLASVPIEMTIPAAGVDDSVKLLTRAELCTLDARLLNPRKLILRAGVTALVRAYMPGSFVLWDNLSEGETAPIHVLRKQAEHTLIVGIREKTFSVSDEYRMPEGKGQAVKMLSAQTQLCVQDLKAVGNKVVIKASAKINGVFFNEGDGSLFDTQFETQFSQIIEVENAGEEIFNTVMLQLRNAEFTLAADRALCAVTLSLCAQLTSRRSLASGYIADAYCNRCAFNLETTELKLKNYRTQSPLMLGLRGRLQSKVPLVDIQYLAISELCTEVDGSVIKADATVTGVGRTESGEAEPIAVRLHAEEALTLTASQKLRIASTCWEKPMLIGTPQNAELAVELAIAYGLIEFGEIVAVNGLELGEENSAERGNRPSIVVVCTNHGADAWSLAKKYGSTVEMIENANREGEVFNSARRPLLIPRAK